MNLISGKRSSGKALPFEAKIREKTKEDFDKEFFEECLQKDNKLLQSVQKDLFEYPKQLQNKEESLFYQFLVWQKTHYSDKQFFEKLIDFSINKEEFMQREKELQQANLIMPSDAFENSVLLCAELLEKSSFQSTKIHKVKEHIYSTFSAIYGNLLMKDVQINVKNKLFFSMQLQRYLQGKITQEKLLQSKTDRKLLQAYDNSSLLF